MEFRKFKTAQFRGFHGAYLNVRIIKIMVNDVSAQAVAAIPAVP
jgi:hypothetical protein